MAQEAVVKRAFEKVTCQKCNQTFAVNKGTARNFKCPCCSVQTAANGMTSTVSAEDSATGEPSTT